MAKYNTSAIFLAVLFVLSLHLAFSAEATARQPKLPTLECNKVIGVKSGDTCSAVTEASHLTSSIFSSINPNLNCDALFVGQWICIDGKLD